VKKPEVQDLGLSASAAVDGAISKASSATGFKLPPTTIQKLLLMTTTISMVLLVAAVA
jgi:hypothetical protein